MMPQPFSFTPQSVRVLLKCPLHYHFLQQESARSETASTQTGLDTVVRDIIQQIHAAGGPTRISLAACLKTVETIPVAHQMIEHYYQRLEQDWPRMLAGNETMQLRISIGGVSLRLEGTVDRLDKTSDGGILAILFRTGAETPTEAEALRLDPAMTIFHALVASTYPLKRPVRLQEWWLQPKQTVTIELSEDEYRDNLGRLREPLQALARSEVMARPGLHCDICPFKHRGCPVYAHDDDGESASADFAPPPSDGKISQRKWIFKI